MKQIEQFDMLVTLNKGVFAPMCVLMINAFTVCSKPVVFHIMQNDFTENQKKQLHEIAEQYKPNRINIIDVEECDFEVFRNRTTRQNIPLQAYYYLLAHQYLPEKLERVLYIDVDTLIFKDILPLYEMEFENKYLIANAMFNIKPEDYKSVKEKANVELINSGVVMLNLQKFRENKIDAAFYNEQLSTIDYTVRFADQAVVNHVFWNETVFFPAYQYNHWITDVKLYKDIFAEPLEQRKAHYNHLYYGSYDEEKACSIIHFCGWYKGMWGEKPWKVTRKLNDHGDVYLDIPSYSMSAEDYAEIYPLISGYYEKWLEYAQMLPIPLYNDFIVKKSLGSIRTDVTTAKNELNFQKNIRTFFEQLAYDSVHDNKFGVWLMQNKNKKIALLKANDAAGKFMADALKSKCIDIVFMTGKRSLAELSEEERNQCVKADVIVQCCVHSQQAYDKRDDLYAINIKKIFEMN